MSLDFQGIGNASFETEKKFVKAFCRKLKREIRYGLIVPEDVSERIGEFLSRKEDAAELDELFDMLYDWCFESDKEIVFIIDEVDSATNNQVFLDFLAQLRDGYLKRQSGRVTTFKSIILAGVTDIKNIKRKIRP
ncbi:MAG: 9-O-acetyl-N-acetylneuraminate esterase, partial [Clostridia bacterium]|nr:9-O-acetyl-N-acetylneuraminate esterase [Clostridia bacterium]